jgi:hypothetical protein
VNCNPSLRIDHEDKTTTTTTTSTTITESPIDIEIKKPIVLDCLKLVAPKKKLDLIEKSKRSEEQQERESKLRNIVVKQRIEERILISQRNAKFDFNKCPLLSKPSELYIRRLKSPSPSLQFQQIESDESSFELKKQNKLDGPLTNSNSNTFWPLSCLRLIYSNDLENGMALVEYQKLHLNKHIADIFIHFTIENGLKLMTHSNFRLFAK